MKRLRWAAASAGAAAVFFGLGFGVTLPVEAPPGALVQLDAASKTYFAPPCRQISSGLGVTTLDNARSLGYSPDAQCLELGGFVQRNRSLSGRLLEKVGLLGPPASRWNANGSWNW